MHKQTQFFLSVISLFLYFLMFKALNILKLEETLLTFFVMSDWLYEAYHKMTFSIFLLINLVNIAYVFT